MAESGHTYGPTCQLSRRVSFANPEGHDDIPHLKAQFFYCSPLPIDDPLSVAPAPNGSESKNAKHLPRPFSIHDNNALEEAWLGLTSSKKKKSQKDKSLPPVCKDVDNENQAGKPESSGKSRKKDKSRPSIGEGAGPSSGKSPKESKLQSPAGEDGDTSHTDKSSGGKFLKKDKSQPPDSGDSKTGKPECSTEKSPKKGKKGAEEIQLSESKTSLDNILRPTQSLVIPINSASQANPEGEEGDKHSKRHTRAEATKAAKTETPPRLPIKSSKVTHEKNGSTEFKKISKLYSKSPKGTKASHSKGDADHNSEDAHFDRGCEHPDHNELFYIDPPSHVDGINPSLDSQGRPITEPIESQSTNENGRKACKTSRKGKHTSSHEIQQAQGDATCDGCTAYLNCSEESDNREPCNFSLDGQSNGKEPQKTIPCDWDQRSDHDEIDHTKPCDWDGQSAREEPDNTKHCNWDPRTANEEPDNTEPCDWDPRSTPEEPDNTKPCNFSLDDRSEEVNGDNQKKSYETKTGYKKHGANGRQKGCQSISQEKHKAKNPRPISPAPTHSHKQKGLSEDKSGIGTTAFMSHDGDDGITGQPFIQFQSVEASSSNYNVREVGDYQNSPRSSEDDFLEPEIVQSQGCKANKNAKNYEDIPVGISKLHFVKVPALQMHPIYWSPVNDIASVTRGTWFYKESMFPVEPAVANQLEMSYCELRPWSKTWSDELNSALEVGAAGEEKISHWLWPKDEEKKPKKGGPHLSTNPYCAAKCFQGEAAAEGVVELDEKAEEPKGVIKKFSTAQVIFKDARNAFILKPTLQPSAYYGRKPLNKIKKGLQIGIHVVRGFDWKAWEKLHPLKKSAAHNSAVENAAVAGEADIPKKSSCPACQTFEEKPKVTDLILVVHGIGQKLSERVESFHFTHAMNTFRRCVNVELGKDSVRRVLRNDLGGVMVLPVNWRSQLSFDDDPAKEDAGQRTHDFTMKDITPDTIPAVRNMISDVMLDIPFYMSQHKSKMIQAAVCEANRVYHLWCKNNPEFHKEGRVHVIAHSLGSVMAAEILSSQPTSVPKIDFAGKKINAKHFDFNTTNLFLAGSPASFFLLLERAKLIPRRNQRKPGAEHRDDSDRNVTGDAGTFGCMAVENVYNIMHYNDPIAYRLNPTVDPEFAKYLKNAQVPSASSGIFANFGSAIRSITPGISSNEAAVGEIAKPPGATRLPSQLELEVHDFTREEIAEKKFYLLNDCGQVDWFLSAGSGPLELQYINMLSAHSSYWGSLDFIRLIVTEVGREPGRAHALPNMKAVKTGHKLKGV